MVELKLSVHQLVDFLLRTGDIDTRVFNKTTMSMGTKMHSYYQQKQNNEYLSEYPLSSVFYVDDYKITLIGRADGIIVDKSGKVTIDEIKTTVSDLEQFYENQGDWHKGQAKCYAYMFAEEKSLTEIDVKLTYISQIDESQMVKTFHYKTEDLKLFIYNIINQYLDFYNIIDRHVKKRNETANDLTFPFTSFRKGQKDLSKYCYGISKKGGVLFAEAPTGIGKTMSTLFPYVKSFKDNYNEKIFYLTAKTSGREAAYKACEMLKKQGQELSEILITAKDKICLNPGSACNPLECPYAVGYYNKIQQVLTEMLLNETSFDYDTIIKYAVNNEVCPFELELDISLFTDVIICDYNYVFDPLVYMKRYFDEDCSKYLLLVDEAHNLVDRSKEMYSCTITYSLFKKVKKHLAKLEDKKVKRTVNKLNKILKEYLTLYVEDCEDIIIPYLEDSVVTALTNYFKVAQSILKDNYEFVNDDFVDFFFEVNRMLKLYELYSSCFKLFIHFNDQKNFVINLYCLDASHFVRQSVEQLRGTTMFSATLSPLDYYVAELGGDMSTDHTLLLDSPFSSNNVLCMVQTNITTKYAQRENSYNDIVKSINSFVKGKVGNYFIFFPSYQYLEEVLNRFENEDCIIYKQERDMSEKQRDEFLSKFINNPKKTTIGFVVLGGAFSEGIDLIDDRLIGVAIIGVGLPQINFKRNLMKQYFDSNGKRGFEYAYQNYGINSVMQAMGRLIRSENDRGAILLIDERYAYSSYKKIFRGNMRNYYNVRNENDIKILTDKFWKNKY